MSSKRRGSRSACQWIPAFITLERRRLPAVSIQLDYSLDTSGFFNTQAKKDLMQLAADSVATDLGDSLAAIAPSGGNTWTATIVDSNVGLNKSLNNLSVPANTIIVYVFGASLPGSGEAGEGITGGFSASGSQSWLNTVAARGQTGALSASPTDYGPWGGAIAFNPSTNWYFGQTTSGLNLAQTDFLTVAEHEIGHVLGIGTTSSWQNDVNSGAVTFVGPASEAAHGGTPVPLDLGLGHWAEGTMSDGHPATMNPVLLDGTRNLFTTLDYAGLQDVGWQFQAPVIQLTPLSGAVTESAPSVTITVTRTGGLGPATVGFATADGTAQAGVDYTATSGTLNFAIGDTTKTITVPLLNDSIADGNESFTVSLNSPTAGAVLGAQKSVTVTLSDSSAPSAPALDPASDTGVSNSDRITKDNGSASAPLIFHVSGVSPANGFVRLFNGSTLLAGPVQASGGTATLTLFGSPLPDGVYQITATQAATSTSTQSGASTATAITIHSSLKITSVSPADGSYVPTLPGGQITITLSHPLAGLTSGGPAVSAANPFATFMIARGPDATFSAPSGIDAGDVPLHINTLYRVNADGTASIVITPTEPLSTDVYAVNVSTATYSDLAGNTLTDATNGFRSFLLQLAPKTSNPLQVVSVTEFSGSMAINNNQVFQPDTIAIAFNKPLYPAAVGGASANNVQLLASNGAQVVVVPSVAAYSPTNSTVYLTPTAQLQPGTVYLIRVDGSVSDDQGFSGPGNPLSVPGKPAGSPFYDTFTVRNAPIGSGSGGLHVVSSLSGVPTTVPNSGVLWTAPVGFASIAFSETVNMSSLGRYSVMLIPSRGGLNDSKFDGADTPLNATLAFNPNLNQLIIVPSQPVGNDIYLFAVNSLAATNGDPFTNPGGTLPFYGSFQLSVPSGQSASLSAASTSAGLHTTAATSVPAGPGTGQTLNGPIPSPQPTRTVTPIRSGAVGASVSRSPVPQVRFTGIGTGLGSAFVRLFPGDGGA